MYRILFVILLVLHHAAIGQIESPTADSIGTIITKNPDEVYKYFIFNNTPQGTISTGKINFTPQDQETNYDLSVFKFDSVSRTFLNYMDITAITGNYELSDLVKGGYQLIYDDNTNKDTLYAWIFINDFAAQKPIIRRERNDCSRLTLITTLKLNSFYYFDIKNSVFDKLEYSYNYSYENVGTFDYEMPNDASQNTDLKDAILTLNSSEFPEEDIDISVKLADVFGAEINYPDTFAYETRYILAEITDVIWDTLYWDEEGGQPLYQEDPKSAPYTVSFDPSGSKKATQYDWDFGYNSNVTDTLFFTDTIVTHTFYPRRDSSYLGYTVTLEVLNKFNCISTATEEIEITVPDDDEESEFKYLDFPNVFTPGVEGGVTHFRPSTTTIRSMHLKIYNRYGRKVYEHEGSGNMEFWKGWDGTINGNGNQIVAPGVYYYVALYYKFYDKDPKVEKGFVYVFTNE